MLSPVDPEWISLTELREQTGRDLGLLSRMGKDGRLGEVRKEGSRVLVKRAEMQRLFQKYFRPRPSPKPSKPTLKKLFAFDPGWVRASFETRDHQWQRLLIARGIHGVEAPALPVDLTPALNSAQIFTRTQVLVLIEQALDARDQAWRNWHEYDPELYPHGPPRPGEHDPAIPTPIEEMTT